MSIDFADRVAPYIERVHSIAPVARQYADWAEQNARPANEFVEALRDSDLFRLLVPRNMGGAGLSPWQLGPIIEALARVDGSAGWTMALGQGLLGQLVKPELFSELFGNPRLTMAGSLNPIERARGACRWRLQIQRQGHLRQRLHACIVDGGCRARRGERRAAVRRRRAGDQSRCVADGRLPYSGNVACERHARHRQPRCRIQRRVRSGRSHFHAGRCAGEPRRVACAGFARHRATRDRCVHRTRRREGAARFTHAAARSRHGAGAVGTGAKDCCRPAAVCSTRRQARQSRGASRSARPPIRSARGCGSVR